MTWMHKLKKAVIYAVLFAMLAPAPTAAALSGSRLKMFAQNDIEFYDPDACEVGSSGSGSGGSADVSGSEAAQKVWSGLISLGVKPEVVAGIMGNMWYESHYGPTAYELAYKPEWENGWDNSSFDWRHDATTDGHGAGLIQWSKSRRVEFFDYAEQQNKTLFDKYIKDSAKYGIMGGDEFIKAVDNQAEVNALFSLELTYLVDEVKRKPEYVGVLSQDTVAGAAGFFAENVEVCGSSCEPGGETYKDRVEKAQDIWEAFHDKTSFGAGSSASDLSSTTGSVDGSQVTIIGDSITHGAESTYQEKLAGADIYAQDSKMFTADSGSGGESGLKILERLVQEQKLRSVLVFALGTNESNLGEAAINELLETAKDASRIVLVTNYTTKGTSYENNNKLFKEAAQKDSRVVVADWAELIQGNPDEYLQDGIHPKPEAYDAYVDLIIQAIGGAGGGGGSSGSTGSGGSRNECCDPTAMPLTYDDYAAAIYQPTDEQLKRIAAMAEAEGGKSEAGIKSIVSLMVNRYEASGGTPGDVEGLISFITSPDGKFTAVEAYESGADFAKEKKIEAAKDVLVNGNRILPAQITEYDCITGVDGCSGGVSSASNDNGKTWFALDAKTDKAEIQRGVTILKRDDGGQWIFWDWTDPDNKNKSGNPLGYLEDNAPSDSTLQGTKGTSATTAAGSSVTWTSDGWIASGMEGYSRAEANGDSNFGADYVTSTPNGKHDPGPNKILLHTLEGNSVKDQPKEELFGGVAPHFAVDIKNKEVFQYMSIYKASSAVKGSEVGDLSAGVQIEIIGWTDCENGTSDWCLGDESAFSDSDWMYLAQLLNAISVETGIPLTSSVDWSDSSYKQLEGDEFINYTGIIGHKHVIGNDHHDPGGEVWERIKKVLGGFSAQQQTTQCGTGGSGSGAGSGSLQELVSEWTWKESEPQWSNENSEPKPAYKEIHDKRRSRGEYTGGYSENDYTDCGGFVTTAMQESGWDPDYNPQKNNVGEQEKYLKSSPKWDDVTDEIHSNADAQPGDVLIRVLSDTVQHTILFVGSNTPGFNHSPMADASLGHHAPMEDNEDNIMDYISDGYSVYRNNQPSTGSKASGDANEKLGEYELQQTF